ncbi:MAG TPA: methyltransferase domain-containing protein [Candidatus Dormibacteraeota bacterium]|nr:methyltransferase domain-containing protein [Candidatus Dormibacteraeota bacterium]
MDEPQKAAAPAPRAAGGAAVPINQVYDQAMYDPLFREYWGNSDFVNFGYWAPGTRDQKEACENLMEKLLAFLPGKTGTILDAACGKGATTRHLLKYYAPEAVTGINISEKQLATCAANAPGCRFLLMNAADLKFEDGTFDNVLCVEAAFHFDTREKFLREACRVLRPGGRLVLSDSLFTRWWERIKPPGRMLNYVEDAAAYRALCQAAGFADAEIVDAREECASKFLRNCVRFLRARRLAGAIDRDALAKMSGRMSLYVLNIRHYLLVGARKAAAPVPAVTGPRTTPSL